jgi:hypothetical protein
VQVGLTTLGTLKTRTVAFKHVVAGHGEIYSSSERANLAIDYTVQRLESILEEVRTTLAGGVARSGAAILSDVASGQGAMITTLSQYVLYNTTVQSALSTLYARGEIYPLFQDNSLFWCRGEKAQAVTS